MERRSSINIGDAVPRQSRRGDAGQPPPHHRLRWTAARRNHLSASFSLPLSFLLMPITFAANTDSGLGAGFMMGVEEPRKGGERICAKECAGHGGMESVITAYRLVVVPHPQCWPHIFSFTIFLYSFTP